MSVLQRIEETYLGILRFIIIVASSVLLIVAVMFGLLASGNFKGSSSAESVETAIKPDEVLAKVAAESAKAAESMPRAANAEEQRINTLSTDPNQVYYERAAAAILKFVQKYGKGVEALESDKAIAVCRNSAERYKQDPQLVTTYASGLADLMERSLTDSALAKRIEKSAPTAPVTRSPQSEELSPGFPVAEEPPFKESPIKVLGELLDSYTALFNERLNNKQASKDKAAMEEAERKATATTQLYLAGTSFASFLFLVFITIVVKIERNLRTLATNWGPQQH